MNITEVRQLKKNEALNKIRKIYNPKARFKCDPYDENSGGEQRSEAVHSIIETLEKELNQLKEN